MRSKMLSTACMEEEAWSLRRCHRARRGVRLQGEHLRPARGSEHNPRPFEVESRRHDRGQCANCGFSVCCRVIPRPAEYCAWTHSGADVGRGEFDGLRSPRRPRQHEVCSLQLPRISTLLRRSSPTIRQLLRRPRRDARARATSLCWRVAVVPEREMTH